MNDSIDFVILGNADWQYVAFVQNDPVDPANPLAKPVNLRGCSAVMVASGTPGATTKLFTLSTADGSLVIDADAGSVSWNMPASQTAQFTAPMLLAVPTLPGVLAYPFGYYTLKITNAAGGIVREFSGRLYLSPDA